MMEENESLECSLTIFKGGTAFNGLLKEFQACFPCSTYIVPITDDGGSSREIRRVFGGPSIGDLRSTLTRLSDARTAEAVAVRKLLEHRLSRMDAAKALAEWHALLEDNHILYNSISSKYKGLIRYFLCKFEAERLHNISSRFDMLNGSIGNFFFSGTRMALGSLEIAIFLYSSVAQIPATTQVLPIIDSNEQLGIGAILKNGEVIIGQQAISHPGDSGVVDKNAFLKLPTPIQELFYIDKFKHQTRPKPHSDVIHKIKQSSAVVYGVGSLWTSIIPSLILEGIGEAIASSQKPKLALLNCCHDRETLGLSAVDIVQHLTQSLNRYGDLLNPPNAYISDLFAVEGTEIPLEEARLKDLGIKLHRIPSSESMVHATAHKTFPVFSEKKLASAILQAVGR